MQLITHFQICIFYVSLYPEQLSKAALDWTFHLHCPNICNLYDIQRFAQISVFLSTTKLDLFSNVLECVLFSQLNCCALHIKKCIHKNWESALRCWVRVLTTQTGGLSIQNQADLVLFLQRFLTEVITWKVLFQQRYFIRKKQDNSSYQEFLWTLWRTAPPPRALWRP